MQRQDTETAWVKVWTKRKTYFTMILKRFVPPKLHWTKLSFVKNICIQYTSRVMFCQVSSTIFCCEAVVIHLNVTVDRTNRIAKKKKRQVQRKTHWHRVVKRFVQLRVTHTVQMHKFSDLILAFKVLLQYGKPDVVFHSSVFLANLSLSYCGLLAGKRKCHVYFNDE